MINKTIFNDINILANQFKDADPFKHVVIDNFLEDQFIDHLCSDFPPFDENKALNEFGKVGPKCVNTDLGGISPFYRSFYEYISSREFLDVIETISGIDNLVMDERMYGGGTHENISGAELDVHVDFNYDTVTGFHRRLNLLLYLNEDWNEEWGGAIELYDDPMNFFKSDSKPPKKFNCIKNRCVMFETNEYSWHGFRKINTPKDKGSISRKLISIYLYTKERPQEEIFPNHGTFYFPYPPNLSPDNAYDETRRLIAKRDMLLMNAYKKEIALSGEIEKLQNRLSKLSKQVKPNHSGLGEIIETEGYYEDKWMAKNCNLTFSSTTEINHISLSLINPSKQIGTLSISLNAGEISSFSIIGKKIEIQLDELVTRNERNILNISSDIDSSVSGDERDLSLLINSIKFF